MALTGGEVEGIEVEEKIEDSKEAKENNGRDSRVKRSQNKVSARRTNRKKQSKGTGATPRKNARKKATVQKKTDG
jgi:hypothetical protein